MIRNVDVSTEIILDTRFKKNDDTFPVKLRVTFARVQKYYALKFSFSVEDYDLVMSANPRGDNKEVKCILQNIEKTARKMVDEIDDFSFGEFEKVFLSKKKIIKNDVFYLLQEYIELLKAQSRLGSAESYQSTMNSLKKFTNKKRMTIKEIDPLFLHKYEKWMLEAGKSITTVGIYLRSLRAIFNLAIENGTIQRKHYPFGKRKYQIPQGKNVKKALRLDDIGKLMQYQASEESFECQARDLWLFSYFCNGMNIADIARLKYIDIQGNRLVFIREKTKQTSRREQKPIVVILMEESMDIIKKWGNIPQANNYVFDILKGEESKDKQRALIKQKIKNINKYIKIIASKLEIDTDISTYWARHTFSTVLKQSGASIEYISEALGHTSIQTTQSYLDSFSDETKHEFAQKLIPNSPTRKN